MTSRLRVAGSVLVAVVLGTLLCTVAVAWHAGDRMYVVHTGSMIPTYQPGDVVVDRPVRTGYALGDTITFEVGPGVRVTHRLVSIDAHGRLHTKGDGNRTPDAWTLTPADLRGVVVHGLPYLGYAIVFLQQRNGVLGVMTSALSIILLWGLIFSPEASAAPRAARRLRPVGVPATWGPLVPRIPRQRGASSAVVPALLPRAPKVRMPPTPPPSTWQGRPVPAVRVLPHQRES